jgi:hypothetical protein
MIVHFVVDEKIIDQLIDNFLECGNIENTMKVQIYLALCKSCGNH